MKKRLLSLVMVFAMLFAFGATAMAKQPSEYYEAGKDDIAEGAIYEGSGTYRNVLDDPYGYSVKIRLIKSGGGNYEIQWSNDNGINGSIKARDNEKHYEEWGSYYYSFDEGVMSLGNVIGGECIANNELKRRWGDCWDWIGFDGENVFVTFKDFLFESDEKFMLDGTLSLKENNAPFTGTQIISGTTVSKTGEYFAVVGGSISGTFQNGTHNITPTDHNLSIFLINQFNGQTRQMTASTINRMSVTVAGGQITQIVINGRAQTTPGGFDTYTLTINY